MALYNSTLWGNLIPGEASSSSDGSIDTTQVIDNLLWSLHAGSRADLVWWTEAELIQWMDEALKRLARTACVFVGRDTSISSSNGVATYTLPDRHIATLHVSYSTTPLRAAGTIELEALDPAFRTTAGTPLRWYEDLLGATTIGLAPVPETDNDPIPVIYEGYPDELDTGRQNTLVSAPVPIKAYLTYSVLGAAYAREGELESQDIAQHCKARVELMEAAMVSYYGAGC